MSYETTLLGDSMSANLLGDDMFTGEGTFAAPFEGDDDPFAGDSDYEGDDLDGDSDIEGEHGRGFAHAGDMFSGDMTKSPMGSIIRRVQRSARRNPKAAKRNALLASIPGGVIAGKAISPVIVQNGFLNITPTRALLTGSSITETIRRFETQYPGTSRTLTALNADGTNPDPIFAFNNTNVPAGSVRFSNMIFIKIGVARQLTIPLAEVTFHLDAVGESGSTVSSLTWSVLLSDPLKNCFICVIPVYEVSSQIYPAIVRAYGAAAGTDDLLLSVTGLPTGSYCQVVLPGQDNAQYQFFKQGFGIDKPTSTISRVLAQGRKA